MAAPALGGGRRAQALEWETLVRLDPGEQVVLVLRDGERLAGRLLEATSLDAALVDFSGSRLKDRAQKRLIRDLLQATSEKHAAGTVVDAVSVQADHEAAPVVRRVARNRIAAAHQVRRGGGLGGLLKALAIVVGVLVLISVVLLAKYHPT